MNDEYITGGQEEQLDSTPLGLDQVNPLTGLETEKQKFKIDASKLKSSSALSRADLMGEVHTDDVLVPKSVYRILGDNYHPEFDPEYNAKLLSRSQTNAGKFVSFLNQAVVGEIAGGTIEALGYLIDLPMMVDLVEGTEQEFGNAITDFGKNMRTWAQETTPIYTDPTAPKFNPTSFEWWMSNGASIASTVSLVLPSMGAMAALQGVKKLVGVTEALGNLGKYSKLFTTSFGQAILSRHMESLMESQQTMDQTATVAKDALYKKYADQIQKDIASLPMFTPVNPELGPQPGQYTKEDHDADMMKIKNKWESKIAQEAQKIGAVGAANTYNKNWVMLLQDLPEYMLLNRFLNKGVKTIAQGVKEESAEVAKHLGQNMPAFYASKTLKQIGNAVGEGLEENYQFLVQQQSSEMLRNLADPDRQTTLVDQLKKNYDNGELWTNTWFGAIGAGVVQATMAGINSKALSESGKARVKQLTELSPLLNKLHSDYIAAEESGDASAMQSAMQTFVTAVAIKSEQMGNKDHLLNLIDALVNEDQTVLSNYEVDKEARGFFKGKKEIADDIKNNIADISKRYNDAMLEAKRKGLKDNQAQWIASAIANDNHILEYLNKEYEKSNARIAAFDIEGYNKPNPSGEQLSIQGKQAFEVAYRKLNIQKRIKNVDKLLAKEDLLKEDREKYTVQKEKLEARLVLANEVLDELSKDETLTKEQRAIDAKLHGDLTKEEYSGTMPLGKNPEMPDEKGVLDLIDELIQNNAYYKEIETLKHYVDKDRKMMDGMAANNKKQKETPTKPKEPTKEEKENLDVGDIATYKYWKIV